ncbi:MAG: hypothetical protein WBA31_05740 [Candidatus Dormiibacterota bacterium]
MNSCSPLRPIRLQVGAGVALLLPVALVVLAGCGGAPRIPARPPPMGISSYSLYVGLDSLNRAPALLASTNLATVEARFPAPHSYAFQRRFQGEFFVGLTLGRLSCRNFYLAKVHFGPRAQLTLTVAQRLLAPGHACFELIGPPRYQVLVLPLSPFPPHSTLAIVVKRPRPSPGAETSLALP